MVTSRTQVSVGTTVTAVLPVNLLRKAVLFYNAGTVAVSVILGEGGSGTDYSFQIAAGGTYLLDKQFTGIIGAISGTAAQALKVTEFVG